VGDRWHGRDPSSPRRHARRRRTFLPQAGPGNRGSTPPIQRDRALQGVIDPHLTGISAAIGFGDLWLPASGQLFAINGSGRGTSEGRARAGLGQQGLVSIPDDSAFMPSTVPGAVDGLGGRLAADLWFEKVLDENFWAPGRSVRPTNGFRGSRPAPRWNWARYADRIKKTSDRRCGPICPVALRPGIGSKLINSGHSARTVAPKSARRGTRRVSYEGARRRRDRRNIEGRWAGLIGRP